jgi:TPR repeat protein
MLADVSFFGYLERSAAEGEAESQFVLGLAYRDGWDGNIKPGSTAVRWCELAAELGDMRPSFLLGLLQKGHDRVARDGAKAIALLNEAAAHGDDYARVMLGEMLLEGDGVPANWLTGAKWITQSARAGFAPAQLRLGLLYLVGGESTPQDDVESLAWFIVAAEAGSKPARDYRDERTQLLGREVARLAVLRSRALLASTGAKARPAPLQIQASTSGSR